MAHNFFYLRLILLFGIPGMTVICLIFRRILWPERRTIIVSALVMIFYLAFLDWVAIYRFHIWSFRSDLILNINLLTLPIEEWVLYTTTSLITTSAIIVLSHYLDTPD